MSRTTIYLLDADTFIQAKNQHYAFDICPGYWTALLRLNKLRKVYSIDRVRAELVGYGDELSDWIKDECPAGFFKKTEDENVIQRYADIVRWLQANDQYTEPAVASFVSGADPWLIAYANVNNCVVVTYEVHRPEARNSVPIPNVCIQFKTVWCDPFEMMRANEVRLRSAPIK